jgi:hypothetical protein
MFADKSDLPAVRRPGWRPVIVRARGDRFAFTRLQIKHPEMLMQVDQISLSVLFEMVTVDHNRRLGFPFPALFLFRLVVRVRVADNEGKPLAVGRPGIIGDSSLYIGQLLGFAAAPVEKPDL